MSTVRREPRPSQERQVTLGDSPRDELELLAGTRVGRYMIVQRVGEGGMGIVFLAWDEELERRIALKFLHRGGSGALLHEAQVLARLSHPNVVQVYEVGRAAGSTFVAMEFVAGPTLRRWLVEERPGWREILRMYADAGRGLAAAHAEGIVHRDFKPDNVIVGSDGRPRVVDFGIARDPSAALPPTGDSGTGSYAGVIGTLPYMAPEQHDGSTDARADQYSFCVALHEALFDLRPFAATTATSLRRAKAELAAAPIPAHTDVPRSVYAAIVRGLKPNPADRWPSMDALLDALLVGRTRHRVAVLAAVVLVAVAVLVAVDRDATDPCITAGQDVRTAWNEARVELDSALRHTQVSYAASTSTRVTTRLDRYAGELAQALATQCRARATDERHDRAMTCLAECRDRLTATIDALREVDAPGVEQAIDIASALPPVADCADAARLDAEVEPPRDGEQARAVEELRRSIAQAASLADAGRAAAAKQLALAALHDAAAIGYPPVLAEAQRIDAQTRVASNEPLPDVRESGELAYELAIGCGHDRVAALAAADLVIVALDLDDRAAADRWRGHAEALAARPGADADVRPRVRLVAAQLLRTQGHLDDAERELVAAREEFEALHGSDHPSVATAVHNLANVEQLRGRLEHAVALYEEALALRIAAFGHDHPKVATALANLGGALLHLGRLDEAEAHLDQAIALLEVIDGGEGSRLANAVSNRAGVATSRYDFGPARVLFERALELRLRMSPADHPDTLRDRANLATVLINLGEPANALAELRGIEAELGTRGPALVRIGTSVNIAQALHLVGRSEESRAVAAAAVEAATAELGASHPTTALAHYQLGLVLNHLGRHDEAAATWRTCLDALDAAGTGGETRSWARFGLAKSLGRSGEVVDAIERLHALDADLSGPEEDRVRKEVQAELAYLMR